MFYTRFNAKKRPIKYTNSGEAVKRTYGTKYDDAGRLVTYETGKTDTNRKIQMYKDSVDLNIIMQRYVSGDQSVLVDLQAKEGFYADATTMPKTLMECLNIVRSGEDYFNSLPLEVRSEYGFDFGRFLASVDTLNLEVKQNDVTTKDAAEVLQNEAREVDAV